METISTVPQEGYEPLEDHLKEAYFCSGTWQLRLSETCATTLCFWTPEEQPDDPGQKTLLDVKAPRCLLGLWVRQADKEARDEESGEVERLSLTAEGFILLKSKKDEYTHKRHFYWDEGERNWYMGRFTRQSPQLTASLNFGPLGELEDDEFSIGREFEKEAKKKGAQYMYKLARAMGHSDLLANGPA